MKAFRVTTSGRAPSVEDILIPEPSDTELRLRVRACGLNFADLLMIDGSYQDTPAVPFTLGMEAAGVVDKVGTEVRSFALGDRIAVFAGSGGLAEFACFPADRCVRLPDEMTFTDAAAFQVAYGTSHLALHYRAGLRPGETLVVLGAAGGVGLTAIEIGKLLGAKVVAVARGAKKLEVAAGAGADHLIDSDNMDIRESIKALGGADVVYDPVGGDQFTAAMRACNPEARILTIGFASGEVPQIPANILLVKNISVIGFYWGGYLRFRPQILTESLAQLFQWYGEGRLRPHISHVLPLDQAAAGLDLLRSRASTGKVVITPPHEPA
jgi:NADPH2:quinone reductase